MSRWFRHYAGMMRDDKLVRVAIRSKQTIERVAWVWGAILESAAEIDDGGRFDVDAAEVAYFLRADEADVDAILSALADAGRVAASSVVKWGSRQFQSDRSKERVSAHRERKRSEGAKGDGENQARNGVVTLRHEPGNTPETETELDTEGVEANASTSQTAKREPFPRPAWADKQVWSDFLANRRKKRLTNSPTAYATFLRDVEKHSTADWPPGRLLELAAGKGWGSINEPPDEGIYNGRQQSNRGGGGRMGGPGADPTLALVRAATAAQRQDDGDRWEARPALPSRQLS